MVAEGFSENSDLGLECGLYFIFWILAEPIVKKNDNHLCQIPELMFVDCLSIISIMWKLLSATVANRHVTNRRICTLICPWTGQGKLMKVVLRGCEGLSFPVCCSIDDTFMV